VSRATCKSMDTFDQSDRELCVEVKGDVLLRVLQTTVPHNETDNGILRIKLKLLWKTGRLKRAQR
jgi:hypothetical protein